MELTQERMQELEEDGFVFGETQEPEQTTGKTIITLSLACKRRGAINFPYEITGIRLVVPANPDKWTVENKLLAYESIRIEAVGNCLFSVNSKEKLYGKVYLYVSTVENIYEVMLKFDEQSQTGYFNTVICTQG